MEFDIHWKTIIALQIIDKIYATPFVPRPEEAQTCINSADAPESYYCAYSHENDAEGILLQCHAICSHNGRPHITPACKYMCPNYSDTFNGQTETPEYVIDKVTHGQVTEQITHVTSTTEPVLAMTHYNIAISTLELVCGISAVGLLLIGIIIYLLYRLNKKPHHDQNRGDCEMQLLSRGQDLNIRTAQQLPIPIHNPGRATDERENPPAYEDSNSSTHPALASESIDSMQQTSFDKTEPKQPIFVIPANDSHAQTPEIDKHCIEEGEKRQLLTNDFYPPKDSSIKLKPKSCPGKIIQGDLEEASPPRSIQQPASTKTDELKCTTNDIYFSLLNHEISHENDRQVLKIAQPKENDSTGVSKYLANGVHSYSLV